MPQPTCLPQSFYNRSALIVARELLGMILVRNLSGVRLSGIILETEAYQGEEDQASHARAGLTPRTSIMYGPPGRAYVYFTYGMHWMLNCVTEPEGFPAAVLLRAIHPLEGLEQMAARRPGQPQQLWCNGPAKLCKALAVDQNLNGADLCNPDGELWIETGQAVLDKQVTTGPRVGIFSVPEPWFSKPWRFRFQEA
ncbi:MAG: DNA-3-methyladenine glycosylase [Anaerolineaceae bacterium]|nr:DNA-3-methyladenine glycosylase [Anaerolineaceae bacterium]